MIEFDLGYHGIGIRLEKDKVDFSRDALLDQHLNSPFPHLACCFCVTSTSRDSPHSSLSTLR